MARIKSLFAIEREFDRFYDLLKCQLRDGSNFTDVHDQEELNLLAARTFDKSKAWDNPKLQIPLEKAHLNLSKADDPQFYEQLCIKHDKIKPSQEIEMSLNRQLDPSMLEYLFEKTID